MNRMTPATSSHARKGFSLAEVSLAVGITAFVLVALLALLPQGLKTLREAGNMAAEARIAQFLTGEVLLSEWDQIDTYHNKIYFFDDQAIQLKQGANSNQAVYVAKVEIPAADVVLPGNTTPETNLRRVVVKVTDVPLANFFDKPESEIAGRYRVYAQNVVRMGK